MIDITRGNALTLLATFTRGGEPYKFDGVTSVRLITRFGRAYALTYTYNDGRCVCALPDTLPTGEYSFEVKGTENGLARRTMFTGMLRVTESTVRGGDDTAEAGADDYDIAVSLSLLSSDGGTVAEHISVAEFLGMLADGTLDAGTLYAVTQPSFTEYEAADGDTVAMFMGQKWVGGLDTDSLRELPVAWSDPSMRACAVIAKAENKPKVNEDGTTEEPHEPYTYRDLISMDGQGFADMLYTYSANSAAAESTIRDSDMTEEPGNNPLLN